MPSRVTCCPSCLQGDPGVGSAAIAVLLAWTCHLSHGCHTGCSIHNEVMVQFKTKASFSHGIFSSYLQAELLLAQNICYFFKILICFLCELPAYMCLCASLERGRHQELSQHPAGVRAAPMAPWFRRAEYGHGVEG